MASKVDKLRYVSEPKPMKKKGEEALFVKVRFKAPDKDVSREISTPVLHSIASMDRVSRDFRFAAAVAEFGMLLSGSEWKGTATYDGAVALAGSGGDEERQEFLELVRKAKRIKP
jgi:Ca-activated chloride channel family protein